MKDEDKRTPPDIQNYENRKETEVQEKLGFLLVNKPVGPTSHDVVDELRTITGIQKIGHAGTLDPFAEGLLILLIGNYTKKQEEFLGLPKKYEAVLRLGIESDTQDVEGDLRSNNIDSIPLREEVEDVLDKFKGKISQMPPKFSAVKVGGRKSYEAARKGEELPLEAREIEIYKMRVIWYKYPILNIEVECSKGTYLRAIARDVGRSLHTGAILTSLRRTGIGKYSLDDSIKLSDISSANWEDQILK